MKHKLIIVAPVAIVVFLAGVALFLTYGTEITVAQRWFGAQLETLACQHINPRLSFAAVRYQYPLTAVVNNVRLVADDPATRAQPSISS